jgi:LacI family transcriptional regulator
MRDIAKELNLSIATVSRALANNPKVALKTRTRVAEAAKRMNYTPDAALNALNAYRESHRSKAGYHGTLAFLTDYPTQDGWLSVYTSKRYFETLQVLAPKKGYHVEHFWIHPEKMPPHRLDQIFKSRGIRGILLPSLPEGRHRIDFNWDDYAIVSLSESIETPRVNSVQNSVDVDTRVAVQKLVEYGYQKPMFVCDTRFHEGARGLHEGAFYVATKHSCGQERPIFHAPREQLVQSLPGWFRESQSDCIVASLVLPELLAISRTLDCPWVTINMTTEAAVCTGLHHSYESTVNAAFMHLVSLLNNGEYGLPTHPLVIRIVGEWIDYDLKSKKRRMTQKEGHD